MSADYHDYFIKDGRHIGLYDEMYKSCPDPWQIEELGLRLDMRAAMLLLSGRMKAVGRFLDIGCGLGLFTGLLAETIWRENPKAHGLITDISPTAVEKAESRLADHRLTFLPLDVRDLAAKQVLPAKNFDLIVLGQVLWGMLEKIDQTLPALASLLTDGGLLLISQHFPGPGNQTYGAEVVSSPDDITRRLDTAGFKVLDTLETNRAVNHHWAALLRKRL